MTVSIRDACMSDMSAVLEIFNEEIMNSTVLYVSTPHTLAMREAWFQERIKDGYPVIVAVENNVVVAFGSYGSFRAGYKYTVEHSVYIHKDHRGKGIAKLIMDWLIQHARKHDFHVMIGAIDTENKVSIAMHKKYGFVEVGLMKQLGYKFGRWLDVCFMQLTFETPLNPE
mmetsp:Transcript_66996/g.131939  ORF Transcript_66996/g.131939 Transcript_66996/m.131939 type:complete len:170 (-) Transcript_66996:84-593(-)|eukprot:CAMPEP_0170354770 /NCGR_PEP_ID=MMETSP0117_2-20130122/285_1 /TAXON_ID=400756 /ORGANISM="Durinskia baltica, Strain CSIRO CS-38" /LENGTH=169 /DNA_ID=CAMNT_0010608761 /DNA_START=40 /DNA_END=549 /DNA_ORIENTATION=-